MFFRFNSKIHDYVDLDVELSPDITKRADGVDIVYWNFCHTDTEPHDIMMKKHEIFSGETVFAGGIWTWRGYFPRRDYSFESSMGGLRACLKNGIKTVFAPMWNDLSIGNHFLALPDLAVYSEVMYRGVDITKEEVFETGSFLAGSSVDVTEAISLYYYENLGGPVCFDEKFGQKYFLPGDAFFNGDPFYNTTYKMRDSYSILEERYTKAVSMLERHRDDWMARYALPMFRILLGKLKLYRYLRDDYLSGNRERLSGYLELLENMKADYSEFNSLYEENFLNFYKPFGYEIALLKNSGAAARVDYVSRRLRKYLDGEIDSLPELEQQPLELPPAVTYLNSFSASNLFV